TSTWRWTAGTWARPWKVAGTWPGRTGLRFTPVDTRPTGCSGGWRGFVRRAPAEEHRVDALHHRAVEIPGAALAQVRGRGAVVAHGKRGAGPSLHGGGGQVEQQLAQVGAAHHATQVALDGVAPALAQYLAHHRFHG